MHFFPCFRCSNAMGVDIGHLCRVRHLGSKVRGAAVLLGLLTLLSHLTELWHDGDTVLLQPSGPSGPEKASPDQLLSLQAELGYLRHKLAACGQAVPSSVESFTPIIGITPTYSRAVQKAELTRLKNAFIMVPSIHWIVVEDAAKKTSLVTRFLQSSGLTFTHLNVETPAEMKLQSEDPHWSKPRGVQQRNLALAWLREHRARGDLGVVYFADDDNTYSPELFEAIRGTSKVSVLPVALVGGVRVEQPQVSHGKVTGWAVGWGRSRPYATDMAGFAVSLSHLLARPSALFPSLCRRGHLESEFLKHLVTGLEELEPVAQGRVLVWHTRTEQPNMKKEEKYLKLTGSHTDEGLEV